MEVIDMVDCLYCGKKFKIKYDKLRKYCGPTCCSRHHARIKYTEKKDDPEYKRKNQEYFKKWLEKNRVHFNDLMREPNKLRARANRIYRTKNNLCRVCGSKLINDSHKNCDKCRIKFRSSK